MRGVLLAGFGGFVGAAARFGVSRALALRLPEALFPWGTTLAVNIIGCLLIGLLAGLDERIGLLSAESRVFLITGVLGGFTTFSAFGMDIVMLQRKEAVPLAIAYLLLSVVIGILAVWVGIKIGGFSPSGRA
jgi:CrcB protein